MCSCPSCRAPISVRLWLMTADCWRCGISIDLTEEEERHVRALLSEPAAPAELSLATPALPAVDLSARAVAEPAPLALPAPAPETAESQTAGPRTGHAHTTAPRSFWRDLPAWLVSLILHLLVLTLLALWTLGSEEVPYITLSARVSPDVREGEQPVQLDAEPEARFDLPIPDDMNLTSPRERKALEVAAEDAKELRVDPDTPQPQLAPLEDVRRRIGDTPDIRAALAARDPRVRIDMVTQEGGTTLTEAAVARGLRWLATQQQDDGSWKLGGYDFGRRSVESRSAATGMALLAYLGAGQTHLAGRYQTQVSRGLRWLLDHQDESGNLIADSDRQAGMYAHGQAAIALCEAFAMTGDEQLRAAAQKSLDFITASQYSDGGWRYTPEEPRQPPGGDTSVLGWQLMALQSGRAAGLRVNEFTLELAGQFLDSVESFEGARYAYRSDNPHPTPTMTAEALLCRIYLGWGAHEPALRQGVAWLEQEHLPNPRDVNVYYWYYGSQVMHHVGGRPWTAWNERMRELLVEAQEDAGKEAGSWPPDGAYADAGGRLYVTCLSICTLEVYYRHLPLFRRIEPPPPR